VFVPQGGLVGLDLPFDFGEGAPYTGLEVVRLPFGGEGFLRNLQRQRNMVDVVSGFLDYHSQEDGIFREACGGFVNSRYKLFDQLPDSRV